MSPISYQFDSNYPPKRKKIRGFVILFFVSVLTLGMIYLVLPKDFYLKQSENVEKVDDKKSLDVKDVELKNTSIEEKTPIIEADNEGVEKDLPKEEELIEETKEVIETEEPKEEIATQFPEKGKPWIGDNPNEKPSIPIEVSPEVANEKYEEIKKLISENDDAKLLETINEAIEKNIFTKFSTQWRELTKLLTDKNLELLLEKKELPEMTTYMVLSGDSFSRVASRNKMTIGLLKKINNVPENFNVLHIGRNLKIFSGPWKIVINKGAKVLILYNKDKIFATFDIGIGRMNLTPKGKFSVYDKLKNPDWYKEDGRIIKYGEEENVLGTVFIKLSNASLPSRPLTGIGIHGTNDESSITKSLSAGCIRMRNKEVEILYLLVPRATAVEIED